MLRYKPYDRDRCNDSELSSVADSIRRDSVDRPNVSIDELRVEFGSDVEEDIREATYESLIFP